MLPVPPALTSLILASATHPSPEHGYGIGPAPEEDQDKAWPQAKRAAEGSNAPVTHTAVRVNETPSKADGIWRRECELHGNQNGTLSLKAFAI